jgi:hypothetical protein
MQTLDSDFKGAFVTSIDEVLYLNKLNYDNFTFNVLHEMILTVPAVFYLNKNSHLTDIINEKIDDLLAGGLIDYWISQYLEMKYLRIIHIDDGPSVLNFSELYGIFQLLSYGLFCSIFVFIVELLKAKCHRH